MNTEILEEIGLTKSETSVYLALLELGSSSTGKIVDKAQVASSKIYEILEKLMQKGLVSFIINSGVKYFEASDPKKILEYMNDKEKKFNEQKKELERIIPNLELKRKLAHYKAEATIYKGLKGMESAFYDALNLMKKGEEYLIMGIPSRSEAINRFFIKHNMERAKRGVRMRAIFNEVTRGEPQTLKKNRPLSQIKFIPEVTPAAVNVFKDRVIIFPESKEILLIVIDSKEVAESFRVQFEKWWNQDTTITKGFDEFYKSLIDLVDNYDEGESYDVWGAAYGTKGMEKKYAEFFDNFHENVRLKKGIKGRLLFQEGTEWVIKKYRKDIFKKNSEIKFLPYGSDSPVAIIPSNKKTLLLIYEKEPTVISINNERVSKMFKRHFESLWNQDVNVGYGIKAVQDAWESMLNELNSGGEYYVMGAADRKQKELYAYLEDFHKRRQAKGVRAKFLFISGTEKYVKEYGHSYTILSEVKFLPSGINEGIQFNLYNNKILIIVWREKEPVVFKIEDQKVYQTFASYFENLWNQK